MSLREVAEGRWFVTYDGKVDEEHAQFGPLPTQEAAVQVRTAIESLEGHTDLWVVRDDGHRLSYDRSLVRRRAIVSVRDTVSAARLPEEVRRG